MDTSEGGVATSRYTVLYVYIPEKEKGEELCPLAPPFSLLLTEEDELGLDVDALLDICRVLQSEEEQRGTSETVTIGGKRGGSMNRRRGEFFLCVTFPTDERPFVQSTLRILHQVVF